MGGFSFGGLGMSGFSLGGLGVRHFFLRRYRLRGLRLEVFDLEYGLMGVELGGRRKFCPRRGLRCWLKSWI